MNLEKVIQEFRAGAGWAPYSYSVAAERVEYEYGAHDLHEPLAWLEDNRALIEAAPKMLEACRLAEDALNACTRHIHGGDNKPDPRQMIEASVRLRHAISEADPKGAG